MKKTYRQIPQDQV